MTLVSIIIPCYRQGHWLAAAVESCLAQTHNAIDIIVVDDGSDDDTAAVAASFGDRIRYIHQPNAGQSVVRNTGLHASAGDYLLFLDADDMLHPEAISRLLGGLTPGEVSIAVMGWKPFEVTLDETSADHLPPATDPIAALLVHNPGPPHCFLSPRTTLLQVGGWDAAISGTSDWDCWLRQLFAGARLVTVPFVGAYYRQSPGQLSRNELVMTQNLVWATEKLYRLARQNPERLRDWGLDPDTTITEIKRRKDREHAHLAYQYRQRGDYRLAAQHYWQCSTTDALKGLSKLPLHALRGRQ